MVNVVFTVIDHRCIAVETNPSGFTFAIRTKVAILLGFASAVVDNVLWIRRSYGEQEKIPDIKQQG